MGFESILASTFITPYRSSLPHESMLASDRDELCLAYQSLVVCLKLLAHTTRPDLSTTGSLLAQHQSNPLPGHMAVAHYATKNLAHTKNSAGSSAEAEIYATDECVKFLLKLTQILEFLQDKDLFMPDTSIIYNDYRASVQWSKSKAIKSLCHIQMKENCVCICCMPCRR